MPPGGEIMKAPEAFESPIGPRIKNYLALKRALGRRAIWMAYILRGVDRFLVSCRATDLTRDAFAVWAESMASVHASTRRTRLRAVYQFCVLPMRGPPTPLCPIRRSFRLWHLGRFPTSIR